MKVLQINSVVNSGSTGRIAEDIGEVLIKNGHESFIAYGRGKNRSNSKLVRIGNGWDIYQHGLYSLLFDRHAFSSTIATKKFIEKLEILKPDLIALHNLHGYYINIELLFNYLKRSDLPVIWTLFDCWAFTGHCSYFDDVNCKLWLSHCHDCPKRNNYPKSIFIDNSFRNFEDKKRLFTGLNKLEIIVHSQWLAGLVKSSFFAGTEIHVTPTAVDVDIFKPTNSEFREKFGLGQKKILLGCANIWTNRKGLEDFIELYKVLDNDFKIVLIGLNDRERKNIPPGILGIKRTADLSELVKWYSLADVFVNPTSQDNFPTVNLEALSCGTPVVTYDTGGSPEAIDDKTGIIVKKGNINGLVNAIRRLTYKNRQQLSSFCRNRALEKYNKTSRYLDYIDIFQRAIARDT